MKKKLRKLLYFKRTDIDHRIYLTETRFTRKWSEFCGKLIQHLTIYIPFQDFTILSKLFKNKFNSCLISIDFFIKKKK